MTRSSTTADRPAGAVDASALEVVGAHVRLGDTDALRGASTSAAAGQVLALLGPSGCGKTTLLRAVAGLQPLDRGRVVLDGRDLTGVPPQDRGVGLVFQDGALFPHLDVGGNVAFGLPRERRDGGAVADALEMVGLTGTQRRDVTTLSGGQQQRVALARSLVTRPAVLLLDEPFTSLDAVLREQLRREVADLLRSLGTTTVVVTHDREEAFALGDAVAVMFDGEVVQQASPAELYERPVDRRVARFLGDVNLLPGHADGDRVATEVGEASLWDDARGPVEVLARPEHLRLVAGDRGRIDRVEYLGHDALVRVGLDGRSLQVRTREGARWAVGDAVDVVWAGPPTVAFPA